MDENRSDGTKAMTTPRVKLPISRKSVAKIEQAGGMSFVCELIGNGMTHKAIAERIGIARSDLSGWLSNESDPCYWQAMRESAEALLDEAQAVLEAADPTSMPSVQKQKAICDLYIRRAGIRNWRYQTRPMAELAPTAPTEMPKFTIQFIGGSYGSTYDADPDLHDPDH